jgi:hypothetical protein
MKTRLTALLLMILFLWGNLQAASLPNSVIKKDEVKIATSSLAKFTPSEKCTDENEFNHSSSVLLFNFSAAFSLRALHAPAAITASFIHRPLSQVFILYRVLRN